MNSAAAKRLTSDLRELSLNPLTGTNAAPLDDNLMIWHCITIVPEGSPYSGIPLHWVMEFDAEYPNKAPKAYFLTHISYWNGAQAHDDQGRTYLCLSLFGNFDKVHTEWAGQEGHGWSSSYTVSNILLTFQSALMDSEFLATDKTTIIRTRKEAESFHCKECTHSGDNIEKYFPTIPSTDQILVAQIKNNLKITKEGNSSQFICYVTKEKLTNNNIILGYGLDRKTNKQGRIIYMKSPCEYLSKKAFDTGTRTSIQKKLITHWIPILINKDHWENGAKTSFTKIITSLASPNTKPRQTLSVLSSLMNSVVVDVMDNSSNTNASERFLEGYYAFYRLLLEYREDLLEYTNSEVERFLKSSDKKLFPNLGEFLIVTAISDKKWSDIATTFQKECDARNVFWYCQGTRHNPARYRELTDTKRDDPDRYQKVFTATEISRNLVCFQTMFMQLTENINIDQLDANNGIPPDSAKEKLKIACNNITQFNTWKEYFKWNSLPIVNNQDRNRQLIDAVKLSNSNGYTKNNNNGFLKKAIAQTNKKYFL